MGEFDTNREPYDSRVTGALSPREQSLYLSFLSSLGLTATSNIATSPPPAKFDLESRAMMDPTVSLDDIRSRNDILLREHFDEFSALYPAFGARNATYLFHQLINPGPYVPLWSSSRAKRWEQYREPSPYEDIEIVKRADHDLGEYDGTFLSDRNAVIMARYGIVAGSLLELANNHPDLSFGRTAHKAQLVFTAFSALLRYQIN